MNKQICIKGVWDSSVPNIEFNKKGISNYYQLYKNLENNYPRGNEGLAVDRIIKKIKQAGRGKNMIVLLVLAEELIVHIYFILLKIIILEF